MTPLMVAAKSNKISSVEALLKAKGINLMAKDEDRRTAYDHAVEKGNTQIAVLLRQAAMKKHALELGDNSSDEVWFVR